MTFAFGETVTVLVAGTTTDAYSGDPATAWELDEGQEWTVEPAEDEVDGVAVASGGTLDFTEVARDAVDSDFDLIFPPTATVTAQNRVVVRGLTCEVSGRPFLWHNPFTGWEPGLVVRAKIREG